jgi:hypothetical protein
MSGEKRKSRGWLLAELDSLTSLLDPRWSCIPAPYTLPWTIVQRGQGASLARSGPQWPSSWRPVTSLLTLSVT